MPDCGEQHYLPEQELDAGDAALKPLNPLLVRVVVGGIIYSFQLFNIRL
jgi:hypothetical protein